MEELAGFSLANALFAIGAGPLSIASPCVLPVLPIVMAGPPGEHRLRPVAIVSGLIATFVLMGVLSSLFGSIVGPLRSSPRGSNRRPGEKGTARSAGRSSTPFSSPCSFEVVLQ